MRLLFIILGKEDTVSDDELTPMTGGASKVVNGIANSDNQGNKGEVGY